MNEVWVVIGEIIDEFSEVVSVWATEELARAAAEDDTCPTGGRYDYVNVERHEVRQ